MNSPSLFIPRIFTNISEVRIRKILEELNLGDIGRIDLVPRTNEKGETFNRGYVHFKSWNVEQGKVRERLLGGHEIKIIYDDPWFWKVSAYKNMKPEVKPKKQEKQKIPPRICYGDEYGRDIPRKVSLQVETLSLEPEVETLSLEPEVETLSLEEPEEVEETMVESIPAINIDYGKHFVPKKRKLGRPTKSELALN